VGAEGDMRIAVAAEHKKSTGTVGEQAARSPYFLLFDKHGTLLEVLANPHKTVPRKAGTLVVELLVQKRVSMVVAGHFGGNMIEAMEDNGLQYLEVEGNIETAKEKALKKIRQHPQSQPSTSSCSGISRR
jgi:predicted Fe-Mo cluster-binding NifX family protein